MKYIPLHVHSDRSLLDGLSQTHQIANRIEEIGATACAITDHGAISASVSFSQEMKDRNLKPLLGCELYVSQHDASIKNTDNAKHSHLPVICKNYNGWIDLIKITSASNNPDHFYRRPRLSFNQLKEYLHGNIIGFSGHLGSDISNSLDAFGVSNTIKLAEEMQEAFGKGNFYLESQLYLADHEPKQHIINDMVRELSKKTGIPLIATPDAHYASQSQAVDQRILLCRSMGVTLKRGKQPDFQLSTFFNSDRFYIPSAEEMISFGHTEEELANTLELADKVENFEILKSPVVPPFPCPNGLSEKEYLRKLCLDGWSKLIKNSVPKAQHQEYADRVKMELGIFEENNLSGYFLICQDIVNFVRNNGWLAGPGRGCLIGDTKVFLANGHTKLLKDINIGDKVYTTNGIKPVTNKFEYDVDEQLLSIKCWHTSTNKLVLTKDHKILSSKDGVHTQWNRADELDCGDFIFYPDTDFDYIQHTESIDLKDYCDNEQNYIFKVDTIEQIVFNARWKTPQKYKPCKRYIELNDDFYYFLGYFTGDGSIHRKLGHVYIIFNANDDVKIKKIVNYITTLTNDTSSWLQKTTNSYQFSIKHRAFTNFINSLFSSYRYSSNSKHVPYNIFRNYNDILNFISGLLDSDGTIHQSDYRIKTTSETLAYEIMFLLRQHIPCSISIQQAHTDKRGSEIQTSYSVIFNKLQFDNLRTNHVNSFSSLSKLYKKVDEGWLFRIRSIDKTSSYKKVYDIAVEDEHNYLTEFGIVHNSGAGCLVSYLCGITQIDPIQYGLLFERFFNAARKGALPDLDMDVPVGKREIILNHLKKKYGSNKVSQMITYQTMKGRAAVKDVFKAYGDMTNDDINRLTSLIPDPAKVAGELQHMKDEFGESSLIRFALEVKAEEFNEWGVKLENDGSVSGILGPRFEQAMRLEGTKIIQSKHAAGVIISPEPLSECCPMVYDSKKKILVAGMEMGDLEAIGFVKLDILGLALLDKLMGVSEILEHGDVLRETKEERENIVYDYS